MSILLACGGETTEARLADAVTKRRTGNDEIDRRVLERVLLVWANLARRGIRPDEEEDVPEHPEPVLKAARLFVRELERHCCTWAILTFDFVYDGPFDARLLRDEDGVRWSFDYATPSGCGDAARRAGVPEPKLPPHAAVLHGRDRRRNRAGDEGGARLACRGG